MNPLQELEGKIIESARNHFKAKAAQLLGTCSLIDYLQIAEQMLQQERARLNAYLTWDGIEQKLISELQGEILIRNQAELLVKSGALISLLEGVKLDELKLLYKLYAPIPDGLKIIAENFKMHVIG